MTSYPLWLKNNNYKVNNIYILGMGCISSYYSYLYYVEIEVRSIVICKIISYMNLLLYIVYSYTVV